MPLPQLTLGQLITHNRKQLKLNQAEAARLLNVPRSTLWRWETERNKPTYEQLQNLQKHKLL